jgi:type II secretory pathway component PulF
MPNFRCTTLDPSGREVSEVLAAGNATEAVARLKEGGRFVLGVEPLDPNDAEPSGKGRRSGEITVDGLMVLLQPAKKKHTILIFRQLAVLLDSGIGIVQALSILERQAGPRGVQRMLGSVRRDVESGETLSEAMAKHPKVFSEYAVNMIRAAELSGEMELAMTRLAEQLESSAAFRRQLITSMIYPGIVVVMSTVVIAILTLVVIPKFEPLLGDGKQLPPATQAIMDISNWMQANWKYLFGGVGGLVVFSALFRKTEEGGKVVDAALLRIPVVGGIIRCGIVVGFARNMSTLFASGVTLVDALSTVRGTLGNHAAAKVVDNMLDEIMEGQSMSGPLRRNTHIFPDMVGEMVSTGEETGELVKVLDLTADIYQKILESNIKRMNALIEPLLILILGVIVGFVFYGLISGMLAVYGL